MINLSRLIVNKYSPEYLTLSWSFLPTQESLGDYTLDIYRSESPSQDIDDYELVFSGVAVNLPFKNDTTLEGLLTENTRKWYYKLKIKNVTTNAFEIAPTIPAYINDDIPNLVWKQIWRKKKLGLDRKSGRNFYLLKKRTWGERCEVSWDEVLFHKNEKVCEDCNCWGTGWRNGYFPPVVIRGMSTPAPTIKDVNVWGELYPSDIILYTLNFPVLVPGDCVIDPQTDQRYTVYRTRPISMLGKTIEQQVQLNLIHPDDEIYSYNIEEIINA